MKSLLILAILALPSAFGDQGSVDKVYKPHEPIVLSPDLKGYEGWTKKWDWKIPEEVGNRLDDDQTKLYLWAPPGRHDVGFRVILGRVLDDGSVELAVEEIVYTILVTGDTPTPPKPPGPTPPNPDPTPDPDKIPDDEFDNIGYKVFAWSNEIFTDPTRRVAPKISDAYAKAAENLRGLGTIQVVDLALRGDLEDIISSQEVRDQLHTLSSRINDRRDLEWDKYVLSRFYKAVAAGLSAIKKE